jgi:hypothetical protein
MSQQFDLGFHPFPVASGGVALPAYARVKTAASLVLAGAADAFVELGTVDEQSFTTGLEAGQPMTVRLRGKEGTRKMIAAGSFSAGPIYAAANGQVTGTAAGPQIGISLESPTAAGQIIECIYSPPMNLHFTDLQDVAALTPAQGDVPYIGAGGALALLAPTTTGYVLETQGAAANPIFANPA